MHEGIERLERLVMEHLDINLQLVRSGLFEGL